MTQLLGRGAAAPAVDPTPSEPRVSDTSAPFTSELRALAAAVGIERVRMVAWRDLDDEEAGGSELHAHRIASLWASGGLTVEVRTSAVAVGPEVVERDGYRAVRRSGRYAVFARTGASGLWRGARPGEALVEIWNGMPFFSPLWFRGPRLVFLHHVHAEMWGMVLPPSLARLGEWTERRVAPPLYRSTRVVTLSETSKAEIVRLLGLDPSMVAVAPPGVDPRFAPDPSVRRDPDPLVVAVGRLVPVKRFDLLLHALAEAREHHPRLRAVLVGEGYERPRLEALRTALGATSWVTFTGRVPHDVLVDWYRRAWVVASASLREGWGMTLTEAGACGTPAVATDIAGHRDAVLDGRTGLLADGAAGLASALSALLGDDRLRDRLGAAARRRASGLTWEASALGTFASLAAGGTSASPYSRAGRLAGSRRAATTAAAARNATATAARTAASP